MQKSFLTYPFLKYQSLGNDFVIFDCLNFFGPLGPVDSDIQEILLSPDWRALVVKICQRNFGIGADSVLVLKQNLDSKIPEVLIFNADGTQAENCLNGVRCVADYLITQQQFPSEFKIKIGHRQVLCQGKIKDNYFNKNQADGLSSNLALSIQTSIDFVDYQHNLEIQSSAGPFEGHVVYLGNPHFIIFQTLNLNLLKQLGPILESHSAFPNKTNVHFVWPDLNFKKNSPKKFHLLTYERGCGVTLSCSTGAAALLSTLYNMGAISADETIEISMLGGSVIGSACSSSLITLTASASFIFSGNFSKRF